jgi:anti-sigma-K factor RskA
MSDRLAGDGHDVVESLLAAYALDAVDLDERAKIEHHLEECPRCRSDVDAYRELAGSMGTAMALESTEPLPSGLWERISAGLSPGSNRSLGESSVSGMVPMPKLSLHSRAEAPSPTRPWEGQAATGTEPPSLSGADRWRGRRTARIVGALALAASVAAIAVLGVQLSRVNGQLSQTKAALAQRGPTASVEAALSTPGHRIVHMTTPDGVQLAEFVVVPSGQGYMLSSKMPAIPDDETYQLWGIIAGQPISLGLLGHQPRHAGFTVSSLLTPSALAITVEPAGGVATPDRAPVASGSLPTA